MLAEDTDSFNNLFRIELSDMSVLVADDGSRLADRSAYCVLGGVNGW